MGKNYKKDRDVSLKKRKIDIHVSVLHDVNLIYKVLSFYTMFTN